MAARLHKFDAVGFVENLDLKRLAASFPGARVTTWDLLLSRPGSGEIFLYPFGVVVFHDIRQEEQQCFLGELAQADPEVRSKVVEESFLVSEDASATVGFSGNTLTVDHLTIPRMGVIALTVAQSVAMEYYERLVEPLFARMRRFVEPLEQSGTVRGRTAPLNRFVGEAIITRTEVVEVLHFLDKPDAIWEDSTMDKIYDDLRAAFDLKVRYQALESKLSAVQQALELVLDVARDRRLVLLEMAIVLLIVLEVVVGLVRVLF